MADLPPATKKPCHDCPWRRVAAAGWLGPYTAEEWSSLAHSDAAIACHVTIRTDDPDDDQGDWDDVSIKQCAGVAQFRTNVFKSPRDPQVARAAERDTETVFGSSQEFIEHHNRTTKGTA